MIKDDENYYNQKNFVRDDWGGQVRTPDASRTTELTDDNMVNGSSDKPFPQEANWKIGTGNDGFITTETNTGKELLEALDNK